MKKFHCFICGKYRKFKNLEISNIFKKTLVLFIICSKYKNEYEKNFKEEKSIGVLKSIGLMKNI